MAGTRLSIGPVRIKRIEPGQPEQPSDSPIFFLVLMSLSERSFLLLPIGTPRVLLFDL